MLSVAKYDMRRRQIIEPFPNCRTCANTVHCKTREKGSLMGALGAFALLYDDEGRLLLCHRRDADVWNLPGGQAEWGESPWQAAIRETREETGLEISVRRLALIDHRPERDELVFTFAAVVGGGELTLNDEVDQLAWFAPSELPANIAPRHAERIIPVLVTSGPPMLRIQPGPGVRESLLRSDDAQNQFTSRTFQLGAFATVLDERGAALLGLRRGADFWGQPGGGVESSETPWDAVVREIREETGIVARVEQLAGLYCWPVQSELIFSFRCAAIGGALQTSDEAREVRFFAPDALPANLLQEHHQRIVDALKMALDQGTLLVIPDGRSAPEEIRQWRAQDG
jgi:8-oxo-dGTP diphosphatase